MHGWRPGHPNRHPEPAPQTGTPNWHPEPATQTGTPNWHPEPAHQPAPRAGTPNRHPPNLHPRSAPRIVSVLQIGAHDDSAAACRSPQGLSSSPPTQNIAAERRSRGCRAPGAHSGQRIAQKRAQQARQDGVLHRVRKMPSHELNGRRHGAGLRAAARHSRPRA